MKHDLRLGGDIEQARRVLDADERWVAAFNREEIATLVAIYSSDVVLMPPDGPDLHGRAAVERWLREFFRANAARQSLHHEEVHAAGDWAWLRGTFALTVTSRATAAVVERRGKHLVIWRRSGDGRWLAARDIWNKRPSPEPERGSSRARRSPGA